MKNIIMICLTLLLCSMISYTFADDSLVPENMQQLNNNIDSHITNTQLHSSFGPNSIAPNNFGNFDSYTTKAANGHPMACQKNGNTETCHSSYHETKVTSNVSGHVDPTALASSALNLVESNLSH